jgi:hypothetical protein
VVGVLGVLGPLMLPTFISDFYAPCMMSLSRSGVCR